MWGQREMAAAAATPRRVFRIERALGAGPEGASPVDNEAHRHEEIMRAIAELKSGVPGPAAAHDPGVAAEAPVMSQDDARKLAEARELKQELRQIYEAISETKREIATLHNAGLYESEAAGVSDELGAIVGHTEKATEDILSAAEGVDNDITTLIAALKEGQNHDLACDIQERVVAIFEACNFQDLTGQRITKVVDTLRFVDERINKMMAIWGGTGAFAEVIPVERDERNGDRALLNGPALESDEDVASQDDIDALFD